MLVEKSILPRAADQSFRHMLSLENLIIFSVAGLPLYLVKLDFFGLPTNILEFLQVITVLWWYADKKREKLDTREIWEKYKEYLMAAGLLLLGLISSLIINGNYKLGLGIIKGWFLLPALFAFVAVNVIDDRKKIRNVLLAFYFSVAAVSLIALVYFVLGRLTYDGRLEAFFNSPNYLAMYLSPALIIGLILTRSQNYNFGKFYYAGCVPIAASLYMTYSYAAWVAVITSLAIAEASARGKNILKSKVFWSGVTLLILLFLAQWSSSKMKDAYGLSERSSLASRLMIWKAAGKLVTDNPFWGIGPGNFQNKYLEYQKFYPPYLEWAVPHPHNLFLTFFLYSGLSGFIGFVWLSTIWFRSVITKENSQLKFAFLALMAYVFIHGLVDTTYFKNDLAMLFWLNFLALNLKKAP